MKRFPSAVLVLAAGAMSLAVAGSAASTTPSGATVLHLKQPIEALAIDGKRLAYDAGAKYIVTRGVVNKVLVWNLGTGKTAKVSGRKTATTDDSSTGAGVFGLAIAGTRVAWTANVGGNTEGDDTLFTSSVASPKERQVAAVQRYGDNCPGRNPHSCAGNWLGGVAGSGSLLVANRWTTDNTGTITGGGLYLLNGAKLKHIASGVETVEAVDTDAGRVVVLRSDGTVALYSSTGRSLLTLTPTPRAKEVALSGGNLVVMKFGGTLTLYDAKTGAPRKSFTLHGSASQQDNLDVEGDIVVYSAGCRMYQSCAAGSIRALNLKSGKDRWLATLAGGIGHGLAHIDSYGLAYAGNGWHSAYGKATLVFVPFAKVAAAVS